MDKKTGGPAFPGADYAVGHAKYQSKDSGMTLRDYFAAAALRGIASDIEDEEKAARWCYEMADAMLKASVA